MEDRLRGEEMDIINRHHEISRVIEKNAEVVRAKDCELRKYTFCNRHKKQKVFHKDMARNKWVFGGNRTGKTECGAVEAVYWATCSHPYRNFLGPTTGWVVSLTARVSRDVAQAKVLKYLDKSRIAEIVMLEGKKGSPEYGVIDYILVHNELGSISKIAFKFCEQRREKFQGASLDWVWFDEEPPQDIYEECLLRTLDREGSCIWGTMTPLKGRSWVYERIFLKASSCAEDEAVLGAGDAAVCSGISYMQMEWKDNPYLSEAEVAKMERSLSEDSLESRKYGRFTEGTGLVFNNFSQENVTESVYLENECYNAIAIDPGYTNPLAALWIRVDSDDNIFVVAEYVCAGRMVQEHAGEIIDISRRLGFEPNKRGCYEALIDSAATQRTLGSPNSVAEQFERCGIEVDTKVNKDVILGIQKMKALFCDCTGTRKIFIYRGCVHLIRELRSYFWGDGEHPVKANDHCIDALRYFISTRYGRRETPRTKFSSQPKSLILARRAKLIKENRANV